MKKILILFSLFCLIGCSSNEFFIKLDDDLISSIMILDNLIIREDYDNVEDVLSHIKFIEYKEEIECIDCINIDLIYDDIDYNYKVNKTTIFLSKDGNNYFSDDVETVLKMIDKIDKKYNNIEYFTLYYYDQLNVTGSNFLDINLDDSDKIIELVSNLNIKNFKISQVLEDKLVTLYGNDFIYKNTVIRIENRLTSNFDYVISWTNLYHKYIEIKLRYNENNNKFEYEINSLNS